jgi:hypothetical protein
MYSVFMILYAQLSAKLYYVHYFSIFSLPTSCTAVWPNVVIEHVENCSEDYALHGKCLLRRQKLYQFLKIYCSEFLLLYIDMLYNLGMITD